MRKFILVVVILLLAVAAIHGDNEEPTSNFNIFISTGFAFPVGGVTYFGLEYKIVRWAAASQITITLNASAGFQLAYAVWDNWSYASVGAGLFAGATVSLWQKLEISVIPGFGINYYFYGGDPSYYISRETVIPGFTGFAAIRYRFSPKFAAGVDFVYWGEYIGPNVGVGAVFSL